jgi:recombination protein RecA
LDIRKSGSAIKDKEGNVVGNHVKVKVVKNKLAPPFRIALFDIMYGEGVSKTGEIVDLGVDHDIIEKSGSWYAYGGSKIAQGRESAKRFLMDNPEVALEIEQKIKDKITGVEEPEPEEEFVPEMEEAVESNGKAKAKK